jgi:farnesyl-diphosphate farnesyltransferase
MPDLDGLLEKTSRTFALSIAPLEEPARRQITVAYLLFRIADTFEDAARWTPSQRTTALRELEELLASPSAAHAKRLAEAWTAGDPTPHAGYRELLAQTPFVLEELEALDPGAAETIRLHVRRSAREMAAFVARSREGRLALASISELREYCYAVAGIVGEMLTEIFLNVSPALLVAAPSLRARAAGFGEALQLTNILKDSDVDEAEGREFLPRGVPRAEVLALARRDLTTAFAYVDLLRGCPAPRGIVEFTALPALLAGATLDRVERDGPGRKLSRLEVFEIRERLRTALDTDAPIASPGRVS